MKKATGDELIKKLQDLASQKEKEIGRITNYSIKTNLTFPLSNRGSINDTLNINTLNTVENFICIMSILIRERDVHKKACEELGVTSTFYWGGYVYEDWLHDVKNRLANLDLRKKRKELKELQEQLDELMSPEMKRERKLEEIQQKLEG
jgi:hypothetical protein